MEGLGKLNNVPEKNQNHVGGGGGKGEEKKGPIGFRKVGCCVRRGRKLFVFIFLVGSVFWYALSSRSRKERETEEWAEGRR